MRKSLSRASALVKATFLFFRNILNFLEDCFLLALGMVT